MELGKNICDLRREKGITQEELAGELGVTAARKARAPAAGGSFAIFFLYCLFLAFFGV